MCRTSSTSASSSIQSDGFPRYCQSRAAMPAATATRNAQRGGAASDAVRRSGIGRQRLEDREVIVRQRRRDVDAELGDLEALGVEKRARGLERSPPRGIAHAPPAGRAAVEVVADDRVPASGEVDAD